MYHRGRITPLSILDSFHGSFYFFIQNYAALRDMSEQQKGSAELHISLHQYLTDINFLNLFYLLPATVWELSSGTQIKKRMQGNHG